MLLCWVAADRLWFLLVSPCSRQSTAGMGPAADDNHFYVARWSHHRRANQSAPRLVAAAHSSFSGHYERSPVEYQRSAGPGRSAFLCSVAGLFCGRSSARVCSTAKLHEEFRTLACPRVLRSGEGSRSSRCSSILSTASGQRPLFETSRGGGIELLCSPNASEPAASRDHRFSILCFNGAQRS